MKQNRWLPAVIIVVVSIFLLLPLVVIGIYSFVVSWSGLTPSGYTLQYYQDVFSEEFPSASCRSC